MANNKFNKYIGAIALGAVMLAVPSCSDDHFDIDKYKSEDNPGVATETLWQLICNNPNLTKFKEIAEKTKYWKDEKKRVENWTYADVLKSGQLTTVWAPEDDYFTDNQKWLDMLEANKGYDVQQQFLGNHIALWRRNISDNSIDTIKMINGKNMIFDKAQGTIETIEINEKNLAATNGTLHTIKGTTPFNYNFYEYLKFNNSLPLMSQYVISKDTTYFNKDASIEGLPDKDGNPSYVDSVYRTSNILFDNIYYTPNSGGEKWDIFQECFNARINQEDSAFIMVMPTDEAWTKAKQKLATYYKYPQKYEDKRKADQGATTDIYRTIDNPDSLANMSMEMDLTTPLVFNVHKQPKKSSQLWTLEDFIADKGNSAEYLLNTFGDTLRNIVDTTGVVVWDKTSLFNGNLVKMSNGYAYEVTEWAYPQALFRPDLEVEIGYGSFFCTSNTNKNYKVGDSRSVSFNNTQYSDIADKYGHVSRNNFYYLSGPGATSNPHVEIKLQGNLPSTSPVVPRGNTAEVMSGLYDIGIVMVPDWYRRISSEGGIDSLYYDQAYVDSLSSISQMSLTTQISYTSNAANGKDQVSKKTSVFEYDGTKVDTLWIYKDFEFPYSYKNLRYSYPILLIDGATSKTSAKKGFIYALCIDRVILKSKETGEETIVDPQ